MAMEEMRVDPQRARQLLENLNNVRQRVQRTNSSARPIRIIAVSKLKPATDILALHNNNNQHRHYHFGENYYQELAEKAALLPRSIRWHFIGALQTNKCKPLAEAVPNLWCVASVDTAKKADALDRGRALCLQRDQRRGKVDGEEAGNANGEESRKGGGGSGSGSDDSKGGKEASMNPSNAAQGDDAVAAEGKKREQGGEEEEQQEQEEEQDKRLRVMVQVNTSGEASKSGCDEDATAELCTHILKNCPNLRLQGLMTIGAIARSVEAGSAGAGAENEDFICLRKVRDRVAAELGFTDASRLELSMGMSNDFESAIRMGSDEIRIGSTIFGERPPKKEAKILESTSQEKA